jgi:hypothetical protein
MYMHVVTKVTDACMFHSIHFVRSTNWCAGKVITVTLLMDRVVITGPFSSMLAFCDTSYVLTDSNRGHRYVIR